MDRYLPFLPPLGYWTRKVEDLTDFIQPPRTIGGNTRVDAAPDTAATTTAAIIHNETLVLPPTVLVLIDEAALISPAGAKVVVVVVVEERVGETVGRIVSSSSSTETITYCKKSQCEPILKSTHY